MTLAESRVSDAAHCDPRWLNVIGIGDDGWRGLSEEARGVIETADVIIGGARHLDFLPSDVRAETRVWSGAFSESVAALAQDRGRSVVVLASGDPLHYGVGAMIARTYQRSEIRVIPHVSSIALVCARMVWSQLDIEQVSLCGRPVERLRGALGHGAKVVVLSADGATPAIVARFLCAHGYGDSILHVLEHLGGAREAHLEVRASEMTHDHRFADLNAMAIECRGDANAEALPRVAGLSDDVFEHDGQMTKREVRALTLARLGPRPGELLWDIGLGSGSVSIEWLRSAYGIRAIGIERNSDRAARARRNADALGVPGLTIVEGGAGEVIADLERPNAIFIGGGLTTEGLVETCWNALLPGGRLVANTVTLESEAVLLKAFADHHGSLMRVSVERADPVGHMTGWRPAMTVMQWAITKPRDGSGA